ncbi:hypothetical protein [Deinococcus sp.]|uniref:hypothetical protein n=1 Tax=Deinococcus sp. TaxID=47478 RepID=UPI003CC50847
MLREPGSQIGLPQKIEQQVHAVAPSELAFEAAQVKRLWLRVQWRDQERAAVLLDDPDLGVLREASEGGYREAGSTRCSLNRPKTPVKGVDMFQHALGGPNTPNGVSLLSRILPR